MSRWRLSLADRWTLLVAGEMGLLFGAAVLADELWPGHTRFCYGLAVAILLPLVVLTMRRQFRPILSMFRALEGTVSSYKDGDFSFSLHWKTQDELGDLVDAHNALGHVLREQRLDLVQRELLLDTMVQHTPVAMLLVSRPPTRTQAPVIVYANLAARQLLNQGHKLEGHTLADVLAQATPALSEAMGRSSDGLFTAPGDGEEEEVYHLARRNFSLNGRPHELLLIRPLTLELRRQEVQTWKKVIRVISHELNNSLAPLTSLAHSGAELVRRGQTERLPQILATIEERTRHLETFILGYARFAKLPAPRPEITAWGPFIDALAAQVEFRVDGDLPEEPGLFDPSQLEQALLNLIKNAHESGSRVASITLQVRRQQDVWRIEVSDRGPGMNDAVLTNALVPFYSTKRSGTGLGLALAREIAEAHGGRITLANREGGGLTVSLMIP